MTSDAVAMTYPNRAHEATHCDRLGVRARLFGVAAAPAEKCRVLELGCAGGANLVGMALDLPDSEFVGFDVSPEEIATGHALVDAVGVKNVKLSVKDVMDISRIDGEFDFIVAHGLYSWVSADAQAKILDVFGELLAPNGVAYVSYNTLPGFYTRAKARDLMRYHTADITDPKKKVAQSLAALKWLSDSIGEVSTYGKDMAAELVLLRNTNEGYIFHEHLVEHVSASWFHELAAAAKTRGLQFLAESEQTTTPPEALPPAAREVIAKIDDRVRAEQYVDFIVDRRFRATLLCRAERKITPQIHVVVVERGFVTAACAIEGDAMDLSEKAVTLTAPQGAKAQLAQPHLKLALGILTSRSPEPMSLVALVDATRARVALSPRAASLGDPPGLSSEIAGALLRLSMFGFVKLRGFAPKVTSTPSERPVARRLARVQAKDDTIATNVWHDPVALSPTERALVPLLDGTRDKAALIEETKASQRDVEGALARLGRAGLLVG